MSSRWLLVAVGVLASGDVALARPAPAPAPAPAQVPAASSNPVIAVDLARNTVAVESTTIAATALLGMCFKPSSDGRRLDPVSCLPNVVSPLIREVAFSGDTTTQMSYPGPHIAIGSSTVKWTRRKISKIYEYNRAPILDRVYEACKKISDPVLYASSFSVGEGSRADVYTRFIGERALIDPTEFKNKTSAASAIPSITSDTDNVVELTLRSSSSLCADTASDYIQSLSASNQSLQKAFDLYKQQKEQEIKQLQGQLDTKIQDISAKEKDLQEKNRQITDKDKEIQALGKNLATKQAELAAALAKSSTSTPDAGP